MLEIYNGPIIFCGTKIIVVYPTKFWVAPGHLGCGLPGPLLEWPVIQCSLYSCFAPFPLLIQSYFSLVWFHKGVSD